MHKKFSSDTRIHKVINTKLKSTDDQKVRKVLIITVTEFPSWSKSILVFRTIQSL